MPKDSNSFRLRFQYYKQTGKLPYKAGRVNEELATDAIQSRQMPIELQQDPLGMLKRLDIARANAANVTAMLNQALIGTKVDVSQLLQNYYADKEDTRRFMERKREGEELADKIMEAALDVATFYVPAARVGWNMMKGAAGALKSGVRAAARGAKNAAETLRYGALGKPRASKDYIYSITPNIQELSLYLKPSLKQTRIIKEDTYPTYIGPKHSVSEVVNADGTVNPRAAMRILHEVADNIPGAYRMENRLENPVWHLNDPTTYHHTRDVARRAWRIDTPSGYTKQDLMIAALGHDFGKIVTGDGHAKLGADLLRQIFPDITDLQLLAIREHMGQNLTTPLSVATKRADIGFNMNDVRYGISAGSSPYTSPEGADTFKKYLYDQITHHSAKELTENGTLLLPWKKGLVVDMNTPDELKQMYYNSVLPRMRNMRAGWHGGLLRPTVKSNVDAALERGYSVYDKDIWNKSSSSLYEGFYNSNTGHIAVKQGSEDFALGHEYRHRLDKLLPKSSAESDILENAYDIDFLKLSEYYPELKDVRMADEAVTTNFDARLHAIGKYHALDTDWKLLNKIIDKLSDDEIIDAVHNSNGYGRRYILWLENNGKLDTSAARKAFADKHRDAMKFVGGFGVPAALSVPQLNNTK